MTIERAHSIKHTCWRCKEPVGGPVCASCGAIQPPPPGADFFALFGLTRRHSLDLSAVEAAYRALSRQVHPDRFARKSAVERRMSLQWTATANEARRVLKDPIARAYYLATGSPRPKEEGGPQLDPAFLESVFELQMNARLDPEGVADAGAAMKAAAQAELDAIFHAWESGDGDLSAVEERLARLKYIDNILSAAQSAG
ncbi:MAG: iron-sulfur cluster co-chaperone HscB C-terminal domain-containing protein [Myxococcota bacterium]